MSIRLLEVTALIVIVVGMVVSAYYKGKTNGFIEGFDNGYKVGCISGEFKASCRFIEKNMRESGVRAVEADE